MPLNSSGETAYDSYDFDSAIRSRMGTIADTGTSQTGFAQEAAQRRVALKQQADDEAFAKGKADAAAKAASNNESVSKLAPKPGVNTVTNYSAPKSTGAFGKFKSAISSQESGNNYGARNASSGAMGKYQIMPSNIAGKGGWDREALGYDITATQFMANPELQEKIANNKLQGYYNKYGPAGAAIAWYAGPGAAAKYARSGRASTGGEGNYPTQSKYMQSILRKMGL